MIDIPTKLSMFASESSSSTSMSSSSWKCAASSASSMELRRWKSRGVKSESILWALRTVLLNSASLRNSGEAAFYGLTNILQGRTTIIPCNFLNVGCYSVFGAPFRDFSNVGCYRRSLARQYKGKLGVIAGH